MKVKTEKIEYYIVKMLMQSDVFLRTYASKITSDLFSDDIKHIVTGILAFYKKNNRIVPKNVLVDIILPKICKRESEIENTNRELENIQLIEEDSNDLFSSIKEEVEQFLKTRKFLLAWIKASPLLEEHKHDEARTIFEDAFKISFDDSMGLDYWEDLETRMGRCKEINEVIPTNLPSLNKYMGGGYRKKALFVFAGPPNVGKTLILNDAASSLSLEGFNVLYLSLELAEDYVSQRTDAKIGEYAMNNLNVNPETAIKKVIAKRDIMLRSKRKVGKLIYKEYSSNTISASDVKCYMKNWELKTNLKFDFVIIDYLKLMKAGGKVYGDNLYNKLGTVCEELRDIARTFNVCVLTASATDRRSMNSTEISMDNLSDSIAIAQTADVLVTLAKDNNSSTVNQMIISIVKSRFSKNNSQFYARIDYDFMKLVEDPIDENGQVVKSNNTYQSNNTNVDTAFTDDITEI